MPRHSTAVPSCISDAGRRTVQKHPLRQRRGLRSVGHSCPPGPPCSSTSSDKEPLVRDVVLGILRVLGLRAEGADAVPATSSALFATTPDRCFPWWLCTNTSWPRASAVRAIHSQDTPAAWVCHRASRCRHPVRRKRRRVQGGFHWTRDAVASQQVQLLVLAAALARGDTNSWSVRALGQADRSDQFVAEIHSTMLF